MKTAFTSPFNFSPLALTRQKDLQPEKMKMKSIQKTDLRNHRFAIIENKTVQDPLNWDEKWFSNYE